MDFGAPVAFNDVFKDSEDFFELEIQDGLANCAKEQALAWREAAIEEQADEEKLRVIDDIIRKCTMKRDAAQTRVQPRFGKNAAKYDGIVAGKVQTERTAVRAAASHVHTKQQCGEEAELRRLKELGLTSRSAVEHYVADTFGSDTHDLPVVVMECGSWSVRAGWAGDDAPRSCFRTLVGRPRHQGVMVGMGQKDAYVGDEAQSKRGVLTVKYPIERGTITNMDDFERILHHTLYNELRIAPEDSAVFLATAVGMRSAERQSIIQVLFETFNVPALYMMPAPALALYSSGRTTGVSVAIGPTTVSVVPVYEGHVLHHAVLTAPYGGETVTDFLMKILTERGYSFTTTAERDIIRDIKETLCFAAADFEHSLSTDVTEKSYELPDGQCISIGNELFRAPEIFFAPGITGLESAGIHDLVYSAIMKADVDVRKDFYANIVVSGASSLIPGLVPRLQDEISRLAPSSMKIKLVASPERTYATWIGGSIMASLSVMESMWITKADYDREGPAGCCRRIESQDSGSGLQHNHTSPDPPPYSPVGATLLPSSASPPTACPPAQPVTNDVVASKTLANTNHVLLRPGKLIQDMHDKTSNPCPSPPNTTAGTPVLPPTCDACGAVASHLDNVADAVRTCAFCYTSTVQHDCVSIGDVIACASTSSSAASTMVLTTEAATPDPERDVVHSNTNAADMVVFCVDVSASMGAAVANCEHNRLECVKLAVQTQIRALQRCSPFTRVAVVVFGSSVSVVVDGGRMLNVESAIQSRYDALISKGRTIAASCTAAVETAGDMLFKKVGGLNTSGCTALGPALAVAIGITASCTSANIVLCTDGCANQGIGSTSAPTSREFYHRASMAARGQNTVISVLTVAGEDCDLDLIGTCADLTAGTVDTVDPAALKSSMAAILKSKTVASDVRLSLQVGCGGAFADIFPADPVRRQHKRGGCTLELDLGATTATRSLTFEYLVQASKPSPDANGEINTKEVTSVPFQVRLSYKDNDGNRKLLIRTTSLDVESDRSDCDANIQHDIVALSTLHQSASQAHAGNYQEARINMLRTLRLLQRQLDVTKGYTRALDQYVAFILQGEQLDGFMREAMAWHAVHGHATPDPANGKRDDPASRAMYQMKQLSIGALSEMAVLV
eukprot:m.539834 g.539834  ORF g.539834 m.539834 type:complete len:1135 (-) comp22093_c0_seq3:103-3507(-)